MKVAISACLLGEPCRYDGTSKPCEAVIAFAMQHDTLPICPEVAGGLPTPRIPSEISPDGTRVINRAGEDVTREFEAGAMETLRAMKEFGCELAVLKAKSPSCGAGCIYDGTFTGTLKEGLGIAARVIRDAEIPVRDETSFEG